MKILKFYRHNLYCYLGENQIEDILYAVTSLVFYLTVKTLLGIYSEKKYRKYLTETSNSVIKNGNINYYLKNILIIII